MSEIRYRFDIIIMIHTCSYQLDIFLRYLDI